MLITKATAEADITVRLPDGNYEGRAIIGSSALHETLVEITMTQPIPTGGIHKNITGYAGIARTFEQATKELLEKVSQYRKFNNFKTKEGLSRVDIRPKGSPLVRLRLHGGTTVDVPSWTKAFQVEHDGADDSLRDGPMHMDTEAINAIEFLGKSIDQCVGRAVVYRPSPDADFVINAVVESVLSAESA
ncbi:hypothetical protein WME77_29415 [Sorangium sp. So ce764]|uniref:hypothetical protein n=1 Tax=Sorangium sp. So ce764 TaxID=3133320 RepID=UPI003F61DFDE